MFSQKKTQRCCNSGKYVFQNIPTSRLLCQKKYKNGANASIRIFNKNISTCRLLRQGYVTQCSVTPRINQTMNCCWSFESFYRTWLEKNYQKTNRPDFLGIPCEQIIAASYFLTEIECNASKRLQLQYGALTQACYAAKLYLVKFLISPISNIHPFFFFKTIYSNNVICINIKY